MARLEQVEIFCSYAHADEELRNELFKHVEVLRRSGILTAWHDGQITAGSDWRAEIETHLRTADIILLLVSVDLLNSAFVSSVELPEALRRHTSGEALLIPVVLRPITWEWSGLSALQALPEGLRPVVQWTPRDLAWVSVCEGLVKAILVWSGKAVAPPERASAASGAIIRQRVLDVGLPRRVPVGLSTVLAVMVRRKDSKGLAGVFDLEASYGLTAGDLKSSSSFPVQFPKGADGTAEAAELSVRIETADFATSSREKSLCVQPRGDSDVCVFLLTPQRAGPLRVNVELWKDGRRIVGCLVAATGTSGVGFEPAIQASVGMDFLPPGASTSMSWYKAAGVAALGVILMSGASVLFPLLYRPQAASQVPADQEQREPVQAPPIRRPVPPPRPAKQTRPQPVPARPQSATVPVEMQRVRTQRTELTVRAKSVRARMRSIRRKLAASGSALRADIVATEASMERHLKRADAAIAGSNTAAAAENLEAASREIARLEELVGR